MTGNPGNCGNRPTARRKRTAYSGGSFRYRGQKNCIADPAPAVWFPEFPGFPPSFRSTSPFAPHGATEHSTVARWPRSGSPALYRYSPAQEPTGRALFTV